MRIPTDISLEKHIRRLIAKDRIVDFYQSEDWKELRQEVLEEHNFECQECLKKGRYTRADCVHHVNEVRIVPRLALSKTYIDKQGQEQKQLIPLCNTCHNIVHEKLQTWQRKDRFTNKERW